MKQKQKQKQKTSLSPLQRQRVLRISCVLLAVSLLWLLFAPGRGLFGLYQRKKQHAVLQAEKELLLQENKDMTRDINRLQNDREYLEQVAREEYGMLKKNEMVFDFGKEKKDKNKK